MVVPILINKGVCELIYDDLKFMIRIYKAFCTNMVFHGRLWDTWGEVCVQLAGDGKNQG